MAVSKDNWIHFFEIKCTGKHKDGFTLYEIVSLVYPKSCPDAITKVVVWKRYSDFKTLHHDVKKKHKMLKIKEDFPTFPKNTYFKRFADRVIEERRKFALELLEYIAKYTPLFTSQSFVKFFETSYVPSHQINGNIDMIRSELQLPCPPDIISNNSYSSEDETVACTSDTDSMSIPSSLSVSVLSQGSETSSVDSTQTNDIPSKQDVSDLTNILNGRSTHLPSIPEVNSEVHETHSLLSTLSTASTESVNNSENALMIQWSPGPETQYLCETARLVELATSHEVNKDYKMAFTFYKSSVACLWNGVCDDPDIDRRQTVKHKIAKYLLRAEKIYNMHLSSSYKNTSTDNISQKILDDIKTERPPSELCNYKVIDLLNSLILVRDQRDIANTVYVMKAIRRTADEWNITKMPVMPYNIPFMVRLHKYFITEQAIYILLHYASGGSLWQYLKNHENISKKCNTVSETIANPSPDFNKFKSESELCYADLVEQYCLSKDVTLFSADDSQLNKTLEDVSPSDINLNVISSDDVLSSKSHLEYNLVGNEIKNSIDCWSNEIIKQWNPVPEDKVIRWGAQLLIALESLHRIGVVWYDLQPKNLLLDDKENLTLTFVYHWKGVPIKRYTNFPEKMYVAPEMQGTDTVDSSVDWWSYGVLLYEMLTGMNFYSCHPGGFNSYTALNIPMFVSAEAHSLLTQLITYEPNLRLGAHGAGEIKAHPFFNSVDWQNLSYKTVT